MDVPLIGRSFERPTGFASWAAGVVRVVAFAGLGAWAGGGPPAGPDFTREVRPILSQHCFKCHGPDENARKAGLRLDVREGAVAVLRSGKTAIAPGAPQASELIQRILTQDEDDVMPPTSTKRTLDQAQKEILRQWVEAGAPYEPHWAFLPPHQAALPAVERHGWPQNPLDYFILAQLEAEGLAPSRPDDRYALIRRVSLDLTGLPPTPEEAEAFASDPASDAFAKVVDRLLASPHYGERWARPWMDLARYADTNGFEKDRPRSMWPWRDWVIEAINADMPFDVFTIEQLAGDLLPEATVAQRIATGFHRNTMLNEEGGIDPLEYRFYSVVDRLNTTGTTWLGLTVGCAQCHTHKYDPITQREYYALLAFLNNADEPVMDVPSEDIGARRRETEARIAALEAELVQRFPTEVRWRWDAPAPACVTANGAEVVVNSDRSVSVATPVAEQDTYMLTIETPLSNVSRLRLEALADERLPKSGPGWSESGNFVLSEISVRASPLDGTSELVPLTLTAPEADFSQDGFAVAKAIDGKTDTGWAVAGSGAWHTNRRAWFSVEQPTAFASGTRLVVRLDQQHGGRHLLGRVRLSVGEEIPDPRPLEVRRTEHRNRKFEAWVAQERERAVPWTLLRPVAARGSVPVLSLEEDGSIFVTSDQTKSDTYDVVFKNELRGITALRLEVLPDERLPRRGPGRVDYEGPIGDFFLSTVRLLANGEPVRFAGASSSFAKDPNHDATKAIDDDAQSGWSIDGGQGRRHVAVFPMVTPLEAAGELVMHMLFEKHYAAGLGRFRVWATSDARQVEASGLPDELLELVAQGPESWTQADRDRLLGYFVTVAPELAPEREPIEKLRREIPAYTTTLVMRERPPDNPRATHVHHRGEFLQPREQVQPGIPAVLPGLPEGASANRLTFARWLVSPANPLTARVTVNRAWAAFFGRGLVGTPGDFGFQGELPTHPELLDWLAVEFMKEGWSLKKLHRLIVTSATYQQEAAVTAMLQERDPENLLLARGPRVRLEAELIRDNALAAAGLLSTKIGGPSVFPPQIESITKEGTYGPLDWKVSSGEDRYRRGLYTFAKRTAPYATFSTFDAPSGEACLARREVSNTPLQALTLLNEEAFHEAAQALGRMAAEHPGSETDRVNLLVRRCLVRQPEAAELEHLLQFYRTQRKRLNQGELDASALAGIGEGDVIARAAWTAVARVVLNLDEMITKN